MLRNYNALKENDTDSFTFFPWYILILVIMWLIGSCFCNTTVNLVR